nr:putative hydrolase [Candidatus Pantoea persica]
MRQTTPCGMKFPPGESAPFQPLRLVRRRLLLRSHWQRLDLSDGDFVDLAWSEDPQQACHKPRVVLFHWLEDSFHSLYAHGLMHACQRQGWLGVVMHCRGCGGEPNHLHRIYHSGETEDAAFFLHWLRRRFGNAPTAAVGVSLGGNMLGCLLGRLSSAARRQGDRLCAAAAGSVQPEAGVGFFALLPALPAGPAEKERRAQAARLAGHPAGGSAAAEGAAPLSRI